MARPRLEVGDIFRDQGAAYRRRQAGHLSLGQLKAMSAIEGCRTDALGGHRLRCESCDDELIAYNSCRNRHCPKCCGSKADAWLEARKADLLDVEYYHVVFTLPAPIAQVAYQNKAVVYDLLFKTSAETLTTLAADSKHLGAKPGFTAVLHTWGSGLTHHPHIHCIVPGGGLSADGTRWIPCKRGFFLPMRVLSRLFRRLFLERLHELYHDGKLLCVGDLQPLTDPNAFRDHLAPLAKTDWYVYAKAPFAGPKAVLTYLARYTHRVAISNHRISAYTRDTVTFDVKDYRKKHRVRYQPLTLATGEFMRRFLLHILPSGFHRIRHYGFLASPCRRKKLAQIRQLLNAPSEPGDAIAEPAAQPTPTFVCRTCGQPLRIVEILSAKTRAPP